MENTLSHIIEKSKNFNSLINSNTIDELKSIFDSDYSFLFKENLNIGDCILLIKDQIPIQFIYTTIKSIKPDIKKGWWNVTSLLLTYPPPISELHFLLREPQFNGFEIFTINDIKHLIKPMKTLQEIIQCIENDSTTQPSIINNVENDNVLTIDFTKKKKS